MLRVLLIVIAIILGLHGLIHFMGFVAYWPLKEVPDLPYKTTLLSGRWDLGASGIRLFSVFWVIAAIGFVVAGIGIATQQEWGKPLLVVVTLLSLIITALDWTPAFRGTVIDVVILIVLLFGPQLTKILPQMGS